MSAMIDDFLKEPEHTITDAELIKKYIFKLTFSDGSIKEVNLKKHLWGETFEELKKPSVMKRFKVEDGTLSWGFVARLNYSLICA